MAVASPVALEKSSIPKLPLYLVVFTVPLEPLPRKVSVNVCPVHVDFTKAELDKALALNAHLAHLPEKLDQNLLMNAFPSAVLEPTHQLVLCHVSNVLATATPEYHPPMDLRNVLLVHQNLSLTNPLLQAQKIVAPNANPEVILQLAWLLVLLAQLDSTNLVKD